MSPWSCKNIQFFPVALGVILASGLVVPFVISVLNGDVSPYMPFISEAGGKPPASGIFSIFLYFTATAGILTMGLRFMVISEFNQAVDRRLTLLNIVSFGIGIIAMMGMVIVAAYPVTTVAVAHGIGANVLFFGATFYGSLQTWISYKTHPYYNGITICRVRLVIALMSGMTLLLMLIFTPLASKLWRSGTHTHWTGSKTPEDKGFTLLVVSSCAEWIMALFFLLYYFTFVLEFETVGIHMTVQLLQEEVVEESSLTPRRRNNLQRQTLI